MPLHTHVVLRRRPSQGVPDCLHERYALQRLGHGELAHTFSAHSVCVLNHLMGIMTFDAVILDHTYGPEQPGSDPVGDKIVVLTMIHPELLSRLCRARDLSRDWEDDEPFSIIAIVRASDLTAFHFIRLFKAIFGETPHQYRSRAQVEKAKHLLVLTNLSITDRSGSTRL